MTYRFFVLVCFFLCGCSQGQIKKEIRDIINATIQFPQQLNIVQQEKDSLISSSYIDQKNIKLVFYNGPQQCSTCSINRLKEDGKIFSLYQQNLNDLIIVVLYSPAYKEYKSLIANLKLDSLFFPVYVDIKSSFDQLNPIIPSDSRYHTFLLDKNNKVVLVGNPLASDAMWDLFRKTLDNMLAHDGVYVPDK